MADLILPGVQLGRLPKKEDPRTLLMSRYIPLKPVAVPSSTLWTDPKRAKKLFGVDLKWGAMLNHTLSCCVESASGHQFQLMSLNEGRYRVPTDDEIKAFYAGVLGVDPASIVAPGPGTYMLDALNYLRKTGIGGEKATGFTSVNLLSRSDAMLRQAIYQFGGVLYGFDCPQSAVDAYRAGDGHPWVVVPGSPSIGGHCILLTGYDSKRYYGVSWGVLKAIDPDFIWQYGAEAYTVLTARWKVLGGFDAPKFARDLKAVAA